jgi:hypothetical protein
MGKKALFLMFSAAKAAGTLLMTPVLRLGAAGRVNTPNDFNDPNFP